MNSELCPLCRVVDTVFYYRSKLKNLERIFLRCVKCDLIFVPKQFHVNCIAQKARYLQHNNDPDDADYRAFLSRLSNELIPLLAKGSKGIDYGAGPGPALALMLKEEGFKMSTFDVFFQPDVSVLSDKYDFVVCTETVEHFAAPEREFRIFDSILKPGGLIGIMTSLFTEEIDFGNWYYQRDPTHIAFYTVNTMKVIAERFNWEMCSPAANVIVFKKLVNT